MQIRSPATHHASEMDRLGDEIAELSAHLDAATARLLELIREFDARGGWNTGFRTCAAWLSWRVGLDLGAARERVRVARALGTLPLLAEALGRGELSYAKVRALTRVATPETEARLLAVGRAGTAAHIERIVRGWRCVDRRAEARETKRRHASRALRVYHDEDGMVVLRGRLEPEVGALLCRRWRQPARASISGPGSGPGPPQASDTFPRTRPRSRSSGRMPWPCSRRRRCITASIPAPRESATRWWSTSTPRCWPTRSRRASPSLRGAHTFPRKRLNASRATPAGWSCTMTARAACSRLGPGPGRFPPLYAVPSIIGTRAAASRGADSASPRDITSATGRTGARPRSRTSRCFVAGITGRYTRRAIRSRAYPTGRSSSGGRTAARSLKCRRPPQCPAIRSRLCERVTTRKACVSPRGPGVRTGSGSD